MLEKSVRMDVGAYRIVLFLRISLLFDVGRKDCLMLEKRGVWDVEEKRMINVAEKETDEFCTKWDC